MKAKTTRRILAILLTLAMVLTLIPAAFASSFPDVADGSWYADSVEFCYANGLMGDVGDGTFNPTGKVTRAQVAQILYNMEGEPAIEYAPTFSDVAKNAWFADAVLWCADNGIVNGDGTGKFNPNGNVTREQLAVFFYGYAVNYKHYDEDYASLKSFPDYADVSSWATTEMQWAVAMELISGKDIGGTSYLKPKDELTRAELAVFAEAFCALKPSCDHANATLVDVKAVTCTEDGFTGNLYCPDCDTVLERGDVIPAPGHNFVDGFCSVCGEPDPDKGRTFILSDELPAGTQVIIYSPGHGMVVTNETDNDWYLVPEERTPDGDTFKEEEFGDFSNFVWDVVDNGDGTVSFVNGDNMIAAWLSGTYIELTNKADYEGADTKWIVTFVDGLAYIQSSSLSNSYGPAYIECYYNANKDKTNISGYTSGDPTKNSNDFGFQIYVSGTACDHAWDDGVVTAPTCTEDGYTLYTCSKCGATKKDNIVSAAGHNYVDGVCTVCGAKEKVFVLSEELADGMQVVIYNPGHGMAIKNENDNNWYLVPEVITPDGDKIVSPDDSIVWTVVDNGDGTISFVNGDNAIAAWLSGTYIELTNDANYDGADIKWIVTFQDGLGYIQSSSLSNSYGPAYIECYYNANKDKTNISGYTSSNPFGKSDFGFQFYVSGDICEHDWVEGETKAATCTEDGYTMYSCSICGASKKEVILAAGHNFEDGVCTVCGATEETYVLAESIKAGDQVVIYNPGHGMAISNENDNNWYLVPVAVTPEADVIAAPDAAIVWTVVDNGDGTFSFTNGDNAIVAWLSGTYIELTNDAGYAGADGKWIVTWTNGLAYIQSSSLSNSYGPAYIECYYNANKDKTNISGYTSGDPTKNSNDFGFQFYVLGTACEHDWVAGTPVAATCLDDGYTPYTCSKCGATKNDDVVKATGHDFGDDNVCDICGYEKPEGGKFALVDEINDGDEVIIYNPGHGMAIKNENDNNWYLVPVAVTPEDDAIETEDTSIVWTVVDNGDGTFSFVNGDNAIVAWLSGTYIELTNDADYPNADGKWIVTFSGDYAYIQSSTLSNSYGPAYIECYYNANKDKTNISGYTSGDPTAKPDDFGFQFFAKGGTVCEHVWEQTDVEEATCTEAGYIINTCALCGKAKTETIAALGHDIVDGACTRCDYVVPVIEGDGFVKVTSTDMLTDGLYLIVYETDSIAFNGGLEKVDAAHNNISVTIEDGVIAADETTLAAAFTIEKMDGGWSILAGNGKYISGSASANTIKEGSSAVANTIEIDENGNAIIFAGGYLMFNKTSGDTNYRFRYYKAQTQQPIQLYVLANAD